MSNEPTLISIVVPAMNEAENVPELYSRVAKVFSKLADYDFELVITDNHSSDDTYEICEQLARSDPRVKVFRFSRNYGFQRSIYAGYLLSTGAAAIQLDADLQDPPELIPQMLEHWRAGANVVFGVRVKRKGESAFMSAIRRTFYRMIDFLSEDPLPRDAGDFRLIDRAVIEVLRHSYDATPYLRGTIAAMGFTQVGFEYSRDTRTRGKTKFNWRSLFGLAADGVMNHSVKPLQLATAAAVIVSVLAAIGVVGYTVGRLYFGQDWPPGFATLALIQLIGISLNALFLGIIGSYVGRLLRQSKRSPVVVIERSSEVDAESTALMHKSSILTTRLIGPEQLPEEGPSPHPPPT
ncbi:MAG: glycosyltransferase family 2 protein [Acidimicrobiia bacterium]|nr:glycosyltransferase family 2 protein [Acidimicrobiia bacterium]